MSGDTIELMDAATRQREAKDRLEHACDFWKSSTREAYELTLMLLLDAGWRVQDAVDELANLYHAAAEDFGA